MASTFTDFDEAQTVAGKQSGAQVCGTLLASGEPRYFLMPETATDVLIRDTAFEIREGRKPSAYENWLLGLVLDGAERQPA